MADITLPQLGETVTEGTITRWFKKVGDTVAVDEPLFEVSTDKVDTEVPAPSSGVLIEIRAQEGDTVPVGAVIAVVGAAGAAEAPATPAAPVAPVAAPAPVAVAAPVEPAPVEPAPVVAVAPAPVPAPAPAPVDVAPAAPAPAAVAPAAVAAAPVALAAVAPAATPTANGDDNRLLSPVVRRLVGEHNIDPSTLAGTGPGGRITREDVLDHIDRLAGAGSSAPAAQTAPQPTATQQETTQNSDWPVGPDPVAAPAPAPTPVVAAPLPEAPAVVAASPVATPAPAAAPAAVVAPSSTADGRDDVVKLSKIRKLTGAHMVMSKNVSPHAFSVVEVDFSNVDATRMKVKDSWKAAEGFSLTYLSFISRAVVDALREFPHLNATVDGDNLVVHSFVDLGIAVDLDYTGLLVPVIRGAETKRLRAIAREINDLGSRARARRLGPDEISGGTFTISNNGSAGSVLTMAIINQPQVAILSTDAIVRKPVVVRMPDGGESIAIHPVGNLAMSWDHRAFDGAYAAGFLVKVKALLETRDWDAEL
jgi:2-oxoglutarate dehydrogenase E2 component (dihydrolipoamide succinyltransferase)